MSDADRVSWIGDRDDCWLVRLRTDTPLWWTGSDARWASLPNACRWGSVEDAQIALYHHLGAGWRDLAWVQPSVDASDEWCLWFSEVWAISCEHSQLDVDDACLLPPSVLVERFLTGIMAGQPVDPRAMTPDAAAAAQRWAAWSLERRARILADLHR